MVPDTDILSFGQCTCIICGNEEPLRIKRKEWKQSYLNPHALERFFDAPVDNNLCTECGYFANLEINTDHSSEFQTRWQPYLLVTGIFLSPVFWVSLALPMNYPELMLISISAIIVSSVIGLCLLVFGYGTSVEEDEGTAIGEERQEKVQKIEEWFKGPSIL